MSEEEGKSESKPSLPHGSDSQEHQATDHEEQCFDWKEAVLGRLEQAR